MKQIAVRVDDETFAIIEAARGDLPRERWMRAAIIAFATGSHGQPVTQGTAPPAVPIAHVERPPKAAAPSVHGGFNIGPKADVKPRPRKGK